jgi:hypothetical protein
MNKGSVQEQLKQWQEAVDSFNEGIGWWERLVKSGMEHLTPSLIKGLRIRFDLYRQLAMWKATAADVVKVLTYAAPFLQSGSSPIPLAEEFTRFRAQLYDLADDERAQLYATLGEQAALMQEGMALPLDPAKVTLASTAHPRANSARAAQLNIQYQQDLAHWQALPWWKRFRVKKPTRPNRDLRLKCDFARVAHGAPVTSSLQRPLNTGGRFSTKARIASLESSYFDNSAVMPCSKR